MTLSLVVLASDLRIFHRSALPQFYFGGVNYTPRIRSLQLLFAGLLHHVPSVTSSAGVAPKLAPERSPAIVTAAAATKTRTAMLFELRNRNWIRRFSKDLMTFGASDPFTLGVDLMRESKTVRSAHNGRWLLVSRSRMALAAASAAGLLSRLHLIRRLVANIAFFMGRDR